MHVPVRQGMVHALWHYGIFFGKTGNNRNFIWQSHDFFGINFLLEHKIYKGRISNRRNGQKVRLFLSETKGHYNN